MKNNLALALRFLPITFAGFLGGSDGKSVCLQCGRPGFNPWVRKIPGEGHGNPLQYSCLEYPMDGGVWLGYSPWGHKESDVTEAT